MNNMRMGGGGGGLGKSRSLNSTVVDQQQSRNTKVKVLRRMGKYLFRHPGMVLLALFLMLSSNILALAGPKLSGEAIDAIEAGAGAVDFDTVTNYAILLVICYALSALLSYCLSVLMVRLSQRIIYTMRREVFSHLITLPVGYFDTHATGDIISHISYDIDTVNASLSHDLLQVLASIVTVVGALVMMISISPMLILVFAITVPISIIFTKYKTQRIRPLFKNRSRKLGELNGYAEEMLSGQKTIRAYSREDVILSRFDARNNEAVEAYFKADYHGAVIGPSVNFINNLSIALVTVFGGVLYMLSETVADFDVLYPAFFITLGGVSAFVQYSRKFAGPINELANIMSELQSATAAAERVFRLIDEVPESSDVSDAVVLADVKGEVAFDHVRFGYVPEKTILHDLNVHTAPGTTVAIVGPTGAGKTTVINLLMRFYDVNDGAVTVDGVDIRTATRRSLRRGFTMVLQDTWLFCGTIFDNITYGKENATMEEVIAAAKAAHIHEYIESLPQGYDTVLTDDGVNISKGQRQLITIARAMLSDSSMLILDEATSNVDSRTEQKIQSAMKKLMEGRTCFVIAHRLSTIQGADVILVVKDGRVIESGDHATLMQMGGFYASLYNSQFT